MRIIASALSIAVLVLPASPARVAAVVHVFHGEMWPELANRLRTIPVPFDLYCTVVDRLENGKSIRGQALLLDIVSMRRECL